MISLHRSPVMLHKASHLIIYVLTLYHRVSRDERDAPLTQYITNARITCARYTITHFKHNNIISTADFQLNECIRSL